MPAEPPHPCRQRRRILFAHRRYVKDRVHSAGRATPIDGIALRHIQLLNGFPFLARDAVGWRRLRAMTFSGPTAAVTRGSMQCRSGLRLLQSEPSSWHVTWQSRFRIGNGFTFQIAIRGIFDARVNHLLNIRGRIPAFDHAPLQLQFSQFRDATRDAANNNRQDWNHAAKYDRHGPGLS